MKRVIWGDMDLCSLRRVAAKRRIYQSPLSDSPSVPPRSIGDVVDIDQCVEPMPLLIVDFGYPYGEVLVELDEVEAIA